MKRLIYNSKGYIDVRDTLGTWSVIKTIGDCIFIAFGINKFYRQPMEIRESPLLFFFWLFAVIKEIGDIPITIAYLIGKWQHIRRKRHKRRK